MFIWNGMNVGLGRTETPVYKSSLQSLFLRHGLAKCPKLVLNLQSLGLSLWTS